MKDLSLKLIKWAILFFRNILLVVNSPYIAFRNLSLGQEPGQAYFIFLIVGLYFFFASIIRKGLHNPYLLTLEFNRLISFSLLGFVLSIVIMYQTGKILGGKGKIKNLFLCWSYTLIPTLVWFFITSIVYLFLPPPRTLSLPGKLFSLLYVAFSLTILYWKIVLYYLTLRFALRLDLLKIGIVSLFMTLFIVLYGLSMYKIGVFRIPFI